MFIQIGELNTIVQERQLHKCLEKLKGKEDKDTKHKNVTVNADR